ncbi:MAG: hypothetical protein Q9O62_01945 [Ardenticatenia bacterium]|nr:hypothetical protein [Ardenticatenia bacterium]
MNKHHVVGQRLAALFFFGMLVFNYPLLSLVNVDGMVGGVPVLYAYLFVSWVAFVGLMAVIVERK